MGDIVPRNAQNALALGVTAAGLNLLHQHGGQIWDTIRESAANKRARENDWHAEIEDEERRNRSRRSEEDQPGSSAQHGMPQAASNNIPFRVSWKALTAFTATSAFWTNNDIVLGLNGIANGTDIQNRIGRKAMMKHIIIRFKIYNTLTTDANYYPNYRISLIYDRQTNGASPTTADIWDLTGNPDSIFASLNLNNRERFVLLRDKITVVRPKLITPTAIHYDMFEWKMYLNHEVVYGGTSSAISDIKTGGLFLFCASNRASTDKSQLQACQWRIRFTD